MVALNRISQYASRDISVIRDSELVAVDIAESFPGNRDGFHFAVPVHEIYKIRSKLLERNDIGTNDKNYVWQQLFRIEGEFYRQLQCREEPDRQSVWVPLSCIAVLAVVMIVVYWINW